MLVPKAIIIHHSATVDGTTFSWPAIRRYHVDTQGWRDIGYHAGCENVDGQWECFYGRPDYVPGAHTTGHNKDTFGFCFVGNYDGVGPDNRMLRIAARRVLVPWLLRFGLRVDSVRPHRDFANKTCPGRMFDMGTLHDILREELLRAR